MQLDQQALLPVAKAQLVPLDLLERLDLQVRQEVQAIPVQPDLLVRLESPDQLEQVDQLAQQDEQVLQVLLDHPEASVLQAKQVGQGKSVQMAKCFSTLPTTLSILSHG